MLTYPLNLPFIAYKMTLASECLLQEPPPPVVTTLQKLSDVVLLITLD